MSKAPKPHPTRPAAPTAARQRVVGLVGHTGVGKTQLAEALLHVGGVVRAPGRVDDGDALLDHTGESRARHHSTVPAIAWVERPDGVVHLVDTPGGTAFGWPRQLALVGTDARVVVLSAADGLEHGGEAAIEEALHHDGAMIVVINKMDRARDVDGLLATLAAATPGTLLPLQVPWFDPADGRFAGVIDVLAGALLRWAPDGSGEVQPEPVPEAARKATDAARERLMETAAASEDALLERYLEHFDLSLDDAWRGLAVGARAGALVPVLFTSALLHVGAQPLMAALDRLVQPDPPAPFPSGPGPRPPSFITQWIATWFDDDGAQVSIHRVWRGTVPPNAVWRNGRTGVEARVRKLYRARGPRRALAQVGEAGSLIAVWDELTGVPGDVFTDGPRAEIAVADPPPPMAWLWLPIPRCEPGRGERLQPGSLRDRQRLDAALARQRLLDPSLQIGDESQGVLLAGLGRAQLNLAIDRIEAEIGVPLQPQLPPVRYREQPRHAAIGVRGLHLVEDDEDVREMGDCTLDVVPTAIELGFSYTAACDEEDIPRRFWAAIGEGARRGLARGPTLGAPVVGVAVTCTSGDYHALESIEAHFERAAEIGVQRALEAVGTVVLEPWSELSIKIPRGALGAVLADIASHRGRIVGMDVAHIVEVRAQLPDREVRTLSVRLDALTAGRGTFRVWPGHYERLPDERLNEACEGVEPRLKHPIGHAGRRERRAEVE